MRNLLVRIILSLGLLFGAGGAFANPLIFDLDSANVAISGYTGPYATVTVTWVDATHATIAFHALTSGPVTYYLGDGGSVGINVSGAFSLASMSCSGGFTASCGPLSDGGAGNEDGFGSFNQTINSFDGMTHTATDISLAITAISGNTWADENSILTANAKGFLAAAHIFVLDPACSTTKACATGFAADSGGGPPVIIPEPQTLALLGLGLLVLGIARRRQVG